MLVVRIELWPLVHAATAEDLSDDVPAGSLATLVAISERINPAPTPSAAATTAT